MKSLTMICLLAGLSAVPSQAKEEKPVKTEASVEQEGVQLHAEVATPCVAGRGIVVAMTLANNSGVKIEYGHINYYLDFDIQMTDAKGEAVPLTQFGQSRIGGAVGQFGEVWKYNTKDLPPGAFYRITLNLSRLFDLSMAGEYTLRIRRLVNEGKKDEFVLDIKDFKIVVAEDEPKVEPDPAAKAKAKE